MDLLFTDPILWLLRSMGRIPAILIALTVHEAAHAWMALKRGDDTAQRMGRVTLNPLAHLDPLGTLMIVFVGFFGWGKPVPYLERNLKNPRWDAMWIAAAGPASNILLAAVFGILFRIVEPAAAVYINEGEVSSVGGRILVFLLFLLSYCVIINLCLCFFNLIPIFPLDGEKVLVGLLPHKQAYYYSQFREYGPFLLILFIIPMSPFNQLLQAWIDLLSRPFFYVFSGRSFDYHIAVMHYASLTLWGG